MSRIDAVFFDCDGTLVDSEVICSRAYVHMFAQCGIELALAEVHKTFKGIKLYEIIDTISRQYGMNLSKTELEPVYRAEVARLFDSELQEISGAAALIERIKVPMCIVSNGPGQQNAAFAGQNRHARPFPGKTVQRLRYPVLEAGSGADVSCRR